MFNKDTPKHETCVPCVGKGFNPPWPTEVDPTTRHSCRLWALFYVKTEIIHIHMHLLKKTSGQQRNLGLLGETRCQRPLMLFSISQWFAVCWPGEAW